MDERIQGEIFRDEGIARAIQSASNAYHLWPDRAYGLLCEYGASNTYLTSEDVRNYAEAHGLPEPPEPRAWGGIIRKAVAAGLLKAHSMRKSMNARAHRRPVQVWRWI